MPPPSIPASIEATSVVSGLDRGRKLARVCGAQATSVATRHKEESAEAGYEEARGAPSVSASIEVTSAVVSLDRGTLTTRAQATAKPMTKSHNLPSQCDPHFCLD